MKLPPYEQTKPSGFKGLGHLPNHWEVIRGRFVMRVNPPAPRLRNLKPEDEVSFVPMDAVGEYGGLNLDHSRVISDVSSGFTEFQDGDVVVAKITPCFENGKAALARGLLNGAAYGTTELHVLRPGETLDRGFLFYVAISDRFRKLGESEMYGAGGQKRVPPEFNKDFPMPMPPVPEQRQIAAFLDWKTGQIDALIVKKKELLEKLKEKRIAVITQAVTQGLNPTAPMRDAGISWFGQVPQHWEVKRLKFSVSKVGSGVTPKGGAESYELEGIPLLRSQNVHFDRLRLDDIVFISEETHQDMSNSQVAAGDVLLNITGASIGRCNFIPHDFGEGNVNQHVCIVRPETELLTRYLHFVLWSKVGQSQIDLEQSGSGREGLTFVAIKNFVVFLPDMDEQAQIIEHVELSLGRAEALIQKATDVVARLTEYRTALITAATTGTIDVRKVKVPQPAA